jgi:hypothetical protein
LERAARQAVIDAADDPSVRESENPSWFQQTAGKTTDQRRVPRIDPPLRLVSQRI